MAKPKRVLHLEKILKHQRQFAAARQWDIYHSPKNLAMALAGETGELLEIFQWLSDSESIRVMSDKKKATEVEQEVADIFYYLLRLSDRLGIDLEAAFWKKMKINQKRYPVHLARANAKKYTEFLQAKLSIS